MRDGRRLIVASGYPQLAQREYDVVGEGPDLVRGGRTRATGGSYE